MSEENGSKKVGKKSEIEEVLAVDFLVFPSIPVHLWGRAVTNFNRNWIRHRKAVVGGNIIEETLDLAGSPGIEYLFKAIYPNVISIKTSKRDISDLRENLFENLSLLNQKLVHALDSGNKSWDAYSMFEVILKGLDNEELFSLLYYDSINEDPIDSFLSNCLDYLCYFWVENENGFFSRFVDKLLPHTSEKIVPVDGDAFVFFEIAPPFIEEFLELKQNRDIAFGEHRKKFASLFREYVSTRKIEQSQKYRNRKKLLDEYFQFTKDYRTFQNGRTLPPSAAKFVENLIHHAALTGEVKFSTKSIRQTKDGFLKPPSQLKKGCAENFNRIVKSESGGRYVALRFDSIYQLKHAA